MPNSYFQFKQFKVEQDRCAMKVCTDACILGAYTQAPPKTANILDIGTGTGLLSLMLAQRYPNSRIDAVELDSEAFEQAGINVAQSPWPENIHLYKQAVQAFAPPHRYQLVISNPPFYPEHLRSGNQRKNLAHHHDSLSFPDLITVIKRLMADDGRCSILLPPRQAQEFSRLAEEKGLYLQHELQVQESPAHPLQRSIRFYAHTHKKSPSFDRLIIRDSEGRYSSHFQKLLEAYYLIF